MSINLLAHSLAVLLLLVVAIIDWQRHEIWHAITIPSIIAAVLSARWLPAHFTANALLGAIVTFTFFLLIHLFATHRFGVGAFGFGDVMLAALIGAIGGLVNGLIWLSVGMLLAGMFAGWLRYVQHRQPTTVIPYGCFLAIGALFGIAFS